MTICMESNSIPRNSRVCCGVVTDFSRLSLNPKVCNKFSEVAKCCNRRDRDVVSGKLWDPPVLQWVPSERNWLGSGSLRKLFGFGNVVVFGTQVT